MAGDVRNQIYKDSETPRCVPNRFREVSLSPQGFWKLSAVGFLPWSDFDWNIRSTFICTMKSRECWKDRIEEPLSDYSPKNRIVKIALDGRPGPADCRQKSVNPASGLFQ